ncbi:MAG TPA: DUF4832 domain-containing protein [Anaerolineales bacterium]|nr:DUF4832 domain-containing protein [Anaerolineales bacterium]
MKPETWNLKLISIFLLSSFLAGCSPASTSPEPDSVSHTYVYSDASLLNPERGFFTPYELPSPAGFSSVRITGNTLVHLNIRFDDWRESDLPEEMLNGLQTNFDDIREAGVKAIIRFAYNSGPYPDSEPDASKAQILKHIQQLTPLLQSNTDVIAWAEAGFIGAWGEWHTSTNGLDNIEDKREILNALLTAIPDRFVQVRYPANIIEMYPDPMDAVKAGVAHHNDCFLSSETDVGTYERNGENTIERDQKYLAELTLFTPMSGETCAPFPPRSECTNALHEMELLHFSAINEAYHKGILRSWEEGGCLQEITDRMGYRLSLISADFNEQVRPGGLLNLTVTLQNTGFASIINERPLYIVLVGRDAIPPYVAQLELDPRTWQPGGSSLTASIRLPSNLEEGEYSLALWLPDESETLQANPLYAVQFANENVWDESTGYNILGKVTVDSSVTGSYERGKSMQVEELSTDTAVPSDSSATVQPSSGELILNPQITNDAENVIFSFDYISGQYNAFQLFIDTDHDSRTGFVVNGVGAEILVENDTWSTYSGSGSTWSWQTTEEIISLEDTGSHVDWKISRSLLNASQFDYLIQIADMNWDTAFVTDKQSYTVK